MSEGKPAIRFGSGLAQPSRGWAWVAVAAVVGLTSCSSQSADDGAGGNASPTKGTAGGQSGAASSGAGNADSGGTGSGGSAGGSGGTTKRCGSVDGKLAYGPLGEPQPLPLSTEVRSAFGFRTGAGYGFVWSLAIDSSDPGPSLYSLTVDPKFKGGEPPTLLAENSALDLDVAPAPGGFVAATCSPKSEPGWIRLNEELGVAASSSLVVPDVPCAYRAPRIVSTGEGYLTSFTDSRGLVVAWLDERSVVLGQQLVSPQSEAARARFSKNGDRVLFVFHQNSQDQAWYGLLDLRGKLLGAVQPIGDANSRPLDFVIVPNRDGWLVASHVSGEYGVQLTGLSGDGLVWREQRLFGNGYAGFYGFTPSAFGGSLLVGSLTGSGQFGAEYKLIALIDDAGDVVYSEVAQLDPTEPWPRAIVRDPLRDLVVEQPPPTGAEQTLIVQEYGCLD